MSQTRRFNIFGMAMPFIYITTLGLSWALNGRFDWVHQEPSDLGRAHANFPFIYNSGMVVTAIAGGLGSIGLMTLPSTAVGSLWHTFAGISLLLASMGLAMAGIFPLPNPLHYGFGLTLAALATPLLGASALWQSGRRVSARYLLAGLIVTVSLIAIAAPPLLPGLMMLATTAGLCRAVR
jgi:hypothetical membrane protein